MEEGDMEGGCKDAWVLSPGLGGHWWSRVVSLGVTGGEKGGVQAPGTSARR